MINRVIVGGRLTKDPELKKTPNGISVCSFSIACERDYAVKGEERETDFYDVVCWRQLAEFVCKYFTKGRMVLVDGRLQLRRWQDKYGQQRRAVEIAAEHVYFGDSRPGGKAENNDNVGEVTAAPAFTEMNEDDGDLPF